MKSYAVFNPSTNKILTYVTNNQGNIPDGYEFWPQEEVPESAVLQIINNIPTPDIISLRQFRMALKRTGLFSKIYDLKNSPHLDQTQKDDLSEFLEYSNTIERNHPLIQAFAPMLGVTSEQIDQIFQLADTL